MEKQFNMNIEDSALFIYGEGGHRAQMNRLMKRIGGEINKNKISLSDYKLRKNGLISIMSLVNLEINIQRSLVCFASISYIRSRSVYRFIKLIE